MKIFVPSYYPQFHCTAGNCRHTCCRGWEIPVDEESRARYRTICEINEAIDDTDGAQFRLSDGETCPFLEENGLCRLILRYGEDILCQTCRDHPRFRSFFTGITELGLGLVCEEAGRLILSQPTPPTMILLSDDGKGEEMLPEDEAYLLSLREELMASVKEEGPAARLHEYLIFRHLPDALYDGRLEERLAFIEDSFREITEAWGKTDGTLASLVETARAWSYDVEYDEDEYQKRLASYEAGTE